MSRHPYYGIESRVANSPRNDRFLQPTTDPEITNGLDPQPIQELQRPLDREAKDCKGVEPREVTPVSAYNWTTYQEPTIIVPGCPPIWQNKPTPFRIARDTWKSFIDQNGYRVPQYPLLPLVLAVDHLSPDFDFPSIDIVTDRNNLRKLLRWINGSIARDFRIDLQLAGSTVLFTRYESTQVEEDSARLGYGRNFEQYTTKRLVGCENSTGHHRIITYNYGNLKLLVRFEVDACFHHDEATQRGDKQAATRPVPEDLDAAFQRMSIRSDDKINIVSRGVLVPQSSLIELSSKGAGSVDSGGIDWQEYFPQLFLSKTPHHYLGVHQRGYFQRIDARALNDGVLSAQQRKQQPEFDKLHVLLQKIKELIVTHGEDARLSLVYRDEARKLEVFSRKTSGCVLPDKWLDRFRPSQETETEDDDHETQSSLPAGESDDSRLTNRQDDGPDDVKWSYYDSDGSFESGDPV